MSNDKKETAKNDVAQDVAQEVPHGTESAEVTQLGAGVPAPLAPHECGMILEFMQRVDLKGNEAMTHVQLQQRLAAIAQTGQQPAPGGVIANN